MPSPKALRLAYAHCERQTRLQARSFWAALYAFCRKADDIADGPGTAEERSEQLAELRRALDQGLWGLAEDPVCLAAADASRRYGVRPEDLAAVVDGVSMDCLPRRYDSFAQLEGYCERVASAVGCAAVAIFGAPRDEEARRKARALGIALQLTNILRDLREDAQAGRCYLPEDELGRFGVSGAELGKGEASEALRRLVAFQVDRARAFFREAQGLERRLPRATRFFPAALASVYGRILDRIEAEGFDPLTAPPRVGRLEAAAVTLAVWGRGLVSP